MGLHLCPIEPDDWANGPPEPLGVECHECEGTGEVVDDRDQEQTCPQCDGTGVIEPVDPHYE